MPITILHRGQYKGPDESIANNPENLKSVLKDYDCEIDLWRLRNRLFLGHNSPQYQINFDFLYEHINRLWIHCKNIEAMNWFVNKMCLLPFNYFWHENDEYTLTSKKFIWQAFHYKGLTPRTIVVDKSKFPRYNAKCYGLCVDWRR